MAAASARSGPGMKHFAIALVATLVSCGDSALYDAGGSGSVTSSDPRFDISPVSVIFTLLRDPDGAFDYVEIYFSTSAEICRQLIGEVPSSNRGKILELVFSAAPDLRVGTASVSETIFRSFENGESLTADTGRRRHDAPYPGSIALSEVDRQRVIVGDFESQSCSPPTRNSNVPCPPENVVRFFGSFEAVLCPL